QFTVHKDDVSRSELETLADWGHVADREHNLTSNARQLTCTGTAIAEDLRHHVGRAAGKRVPEAIFAASYSSKLAFAAAWFNGDGWQDDDGLHWSMATSGRTRSLDLQQLLASIGIPASVHSIDHPTDRGLIRGKEREYVVNVSNAHSDIFASVSKAEVTKKRKCPMSVFISGDYLMVPIRSVRRELGDVEVHNFSVEEDESYTAANLAMHNCKVPFDVCTICGHKAANRKEYCDHLTNEMCHVKEGGWQVGAINDRPLFFDISGVFRPADRIAYGLQKIASTGELPEEFIPSARIAELWGISAPMSVLMDSSPRPVQEKLAAMQRMAAMEKQIEATGRLIGSDVDAGHPTGSMPEEAIGQMRGCDMNNLMGALASAKICLPVGDFLRYVLGNKYDSVAGETDKVASLLPGIYSRMLKSGDGVDDVTGMTSYDPGASLVPKAVRDLIELQKSSMSMAMEPIMRRLQLIIIRGDRPDGTELRKISSDQTPGKTASWLAKQYAAYQLAFVRTAAGAGDGLTEEMTVLRNYAA
ncbi:MAG TPA: hypothetical protein VM487_11745, partial [Phycisphaerae bacterium]|nr:hypothetical protein [Phycisphaerae bacterium]